MSRASLEVERRDQPNNPSQGTKLMRVPWASKRPSSASTAAAWDRAAWGIGGVAGARRNGRIFPIVRRQSEELALGYVTARLFECMFILVGIVAVLGIVTLQQEVAGPVEGSIAYTLAAIKDWTFLLGPGWVVGRGNGLILGYLMYSSGLVPKKMAWLGLVGGPLIILAGTLVLFGVADRGGALQGIATIPEFPWELSLGIYCAVKGFRPSSPILRADAGDGRVRGMPASAPA